MLLIVRFLSFLFLLLSLFFIYRLISDSKNRKINVRRFFIVLLMLVVAIIEGPLLTPEVRARKYSYDGQKAFDNKDFERAKELFEKSLKLDPDGKESANARDLLSKI